MPSKFSLKTLCVQSSLRQSGHPIIPPVDLATIHVQGEAVGYGQITYPRFGTSAGQVALSKKLAVLEGGEAAAVTSSGMTAISTVLMSILKAGDHLLASKHLYGGTVEVLEALSNYGIEVAYLDDLNDTALEQSRRETTKAIWLESISNPMMRVPPLDAVVQFARRHGLVSVIDNTFATPVHYQPLRQGFDIALHSASKFLNGHSDLIAGVVVGSENLMRTAQLHLRTFGGFLDPHSCYMLERGLKTLVLRVTAQSRNAEVLAGKLAQHSKVERVHYPGLETHPDHQRAVEQFQGFGSMLAVEFKSAETAQCFVRRLRLACHSASLGGVETLASIPANTSHANLSPAEKNSTGIGPNLVRISAGIEDASDLWDDFQQALE